MELQQKLEAAKQLQAEYEAELAAVEAAAEDHDTRITAVIDAYAGAAPEPAAALLRKKKGK